MKKKIFLSLLATLIADSGVYIARRAAARESPSDRIRVRIW